MKLEEYVVRGGQKLRMGYTTGSCAAAAAKAATVMLLTGQQIPEVRLRTPKGTDLILEIEDTQFFYGPADSGSGADEKTDFGKHREKSPVDVETVENIAAVSCAVRKDSGDDPDITNHILIYAHVACSSVPGVRIEGGEGVGRVTKPGLDQPVGNAAINSTPRRMIAEAVLEAAASCRRLPAGFDVTISVPEGRALADRTFNPKLGIEGGISILGTTGIVEPMSEQALLDTIRVEIRVRKEEGYTVLPVVPGNYGKNFFQEKYGFSLDTAVTASNFIYDTVQMAAEAGFTRMLFTGHIGKLVKIAGGVRNTHSKYGDRRMEILTEIAEQTAGGPDERFGELSGERSGERFGNLPGDLTGETPSELSGERSGELPGDLPGEVAGDLTGEKPGNLSGDLTGGIAGGLSGEKLEELRRQLAECVTTEEAVRVLRERQLDTAVLTEMTRRIQAVMEGWTGGKMKVEVIVFSMQYGELGKTDGAMELLRILRAQMRGTEDGKY